MAKNSATVGVLALVLASVGCGGGEEPAPETAPATQELTPDEAALLAEHRAKQAAGGADNGPPEAGGDPETNPPPASGSARLRPTVFREHPIRDGGQLAMTLLVPETWKVEGGITRSANHYYSTPILTDIKIAAPDGRQAHFFPSLSFEFTAQAQAQGAQLFAPIGDGNMYYPLPETPGAWIMQLARNQPDPTVSNLKLVSEEVEPTLTAQLQQQSAALYQMVQDGKFAAAQTGIDMAFDTQATVVKLRYTQGGVDLEESVLVVWQYFLNLWNGQVSGGQWSVSLMVSARGPAGSDYGNDPELTAVFNSVRIDPAWQAEMNRYWQELARIRSRGAADRSRQWQAHNAKMQEINNDTMNIISQGYANRTAIRDAGHAKQVDAIHEVMPYTTPAGETVKLPSFYDNVYTDGNGRYILSNDAFYNPQSDNGLTGSWTRIEAQQ